MKRLVIELENNLKRSLTPVSGEKMELALRRYAPHLRGTKPLRVFIQEYDADLSSRFRYTPAPQLLESLIKELSNFH